jgi:hypothetical protein
MKAVLLFGEGDVYTALPYELKDDAVFTAKDFMAAKKVKSYEVPYEIRNILAPKDEEGV